MKKLLLIAMKTFPCLEVWARLIYEKLKKKHPKLKIRAQKRGKLVAPWVHLDQIKQALVQVGIQNGDFLIIHSSMDGLKGVDATAVEWITMLQELVGKEGTIAFAAFPLLGDRDCVIEDGKKILIYNADKIKVSTGIMPNVFCRMQDVIRSKCPSNTLAAWGKEAKAMMEHNLDDDLAHGKSSSWYYAVQHHAKILYLGIPVTEADTVVHVAEDCLDQEWPIANWYRQSEYYILHQGEKIIKPMRLRDGYWHRYFISQYSGKILDKYGFRKKVVVDGIILELVTDSKEYVEYLMKQAKKGKLLYRIPKKYWRDKNGKA